MSFGPHLIIDAYSDLLPVKLNDVGFWNIFLGELVDRAGMTVIYGPVVQDTSCSNVAWDPPDVTGLSGFVVLAESHAGVEVLPLPGPRSRASFHTFVEKGFVFLDIFSCKMFDTDDLLGWIMDTLKLHDTNPTLLMRGLNWR